VQNDLFKLKEEYGFESGDISESFAKKVTTNGIFSCDLETSGLDWRSERIGLVQIFSPGLDVVVFKPEAKKTPNRLIRLLNDPAILKIFHHAMFDLRFITYHWKAKPANIGCTKIASKILQPDRESHSLAVLLKDYLNIIVDKTSQKSDWLSWDLTELQLAYAKADVAHLPDLFAKLMSELKQQDKAELAQNCFDHLKTRVALELGGYGDVFAY